MPAMRLYKRNGVYYIGYDRCSRMSLKTRDKRTAEALFKRAQREYLASKVNELDRVELVTLASFEQTFFSRHTDIADKTRAAYLLAFKLIKDAWGPSTPISRIDEVRIDDFKAKCLARGVRKTSVNTYLRHIRGILNKAHEWGYVQAKPKVKLLTIPKRHPRILTQVEISAILEYSKAHYPEMFRIITFALWTGARRAEICSLTWSMVSGRTCRLIGKGDKERTVPLLSGAVEALGARKDIGKVFQVKNDIDLITKAFKRIARACGIHDAHFHHLRHTAATSMLMSGISLATVREILGHVDLSTTEIYARILQERVIDEAMEKGQNLYERSVK